MFDVLREELVLENQFSPQDVKHCVCQLHDESISAPKQGAVCSALITDGDKKQQPDNQAFASDYL